MEEPGQVAQCCLMLGISAAAEAPEVGYARGSW